MLSPRGLGFSAAHQSDSSVRRALARVMPAAGELELRWLWFAGRVACWGWDDAVWDAVSARLLERASDRRVSTS